MYTVAKYSLVPRPFLYGLAPPIQEGSGNQTKRSVSHLWQTCAYDERMRLIIRCNIAILRRSISRPFNYLWFN